MTSFVHLDEASVEAIVHRVVQGLREDASLLDASGVARRLGRSREWVYRHADELGVVRLGEGQRPRLGFEPAKVAEYVDACESSRRTSEPPKRAAKRKSHPAHGGANGQGG